MEGKETGAWCADCKGGVHPLRSKPCSWHGFTIGGAKVKKYNGLSEKGFLTSAACKQLFSCWKYTALWGRGGKVAQRAVSNKVSDVAVCSMV